MQFTFVHAVLGGLSVLSLGLLLWQWIAGLRFPLHRRERTTPFAPPLTLLKPLKGCDAETRTCLQSWFAQEYSGETQILLGVASPSDPVCNLVRELIAEFPQRDAELVICEEQLGPNAKVSTLIHLEQRAKHPFVVVSDADVRVPNDFLGQGVQPLSDSAVGLVNCFYRFANPSTYPMHWEACAVNGDFWSQVLQSAMLKPIDFALGAAMLLRRSDLQKIGGFRGLVEHLADDYQLGNRIAKTGKRLVISPVVVECWESPRNFKQIWNHQLRWARTIRVCQPVPFFFSILSNASLWPVAWSIALLAVGGPISWCLPLFTFLLARILVSLHLQTKLTGATLHFRQYWIVTAKDLLGFLIWLLSFTGSTVEWRGETFKVVRGGKMVRTGPGR